MMGRRAGGVGEEEDLVAGIAWWASKWILRFAQNDKQKSADAFGGTGEARKIRTQEPFGYAQGRLLARPPRQIAVDEGQADLIEVGADGQSERAPCDL